MEWIFSKFIPTVCVQGHSKLTTYIKDHSKVEPTTTTNDAWCGLIFWQWGQRIFTTLVGACAISAFPGDWLLHKYLTSHVHYPMEYSIILMLFSFVQQLTHMTSKIHVYSSRSRESTIISRLFYIFYEF